MSKSQEILNRLFGTEDNRNVVVFFRPLILSMRDSNGILGKTHLIETHIANVPKWILDAVSKYERIVKGKKLKPKVNEYIFELGQGRVINGVPDDVFLFILNWGSLVIDKKNDKYYVCFVIPPTLKDAFTNMIVPVVGTTSPLLALPPRAPKQMSHFLIVESKKLVRDIVNSLTLIAGSPNLPKRSTLPSTQKEEPPNYIY